MSAWVFVIEGRTGRTAWEWIDEAPDREALRYLLGEYRTAFGPGWSFRVKRRRA